MPLQRSAFLERRRFKTGRGRSQAARWISGVLRRMGFCYDLSIDLRHFDMVKELPKEAVKVAESGIDPRQLRDLRDRLGFHAALVGTSILMSKRGPRFALEEFERELSPRGSKARRPEGAVGAAV